MFVAIGNVYSMDGTITPLFAILDTMDEVSPAGNTHPVVNEAHAMGLYGPGGRGIVALLGWRTAYSPGCIRLARRSLRQVVRVSSICQYKLKWTRVVDEHIDSRSSPQLRASINIHGISQHCRYHRCLVFLRPLRGPHSRKGTVRIPAIRPLAKRRAPVVHPCKILWRKVLGRLTYLRLSPCTSSHCQPAFNNPR